MTKVVANGCFGGFSLSREACDALKERNPSKFEEVDPNYGYLPYDTPRNDPDLVWVVEFLGVKAASGSHAALYVVELPDGVPFEVDEYDGSESVKVDFAQVCADLLADLEENNDPQMARDTLRNALVAPRELD